MYRVLVIGGTLFIGKALVARLLERGDDVTILHRGQHNPFAGHAREIHCDRNDKVAVAKAVRGSYDLVFDNVYDWQRGTTGDQVLAAAAACGDNLRRYIFVSSCAAYGDGLDRDEGAPLAPPDFADIYCRNKANSERALLGLYAKRGVPTATLRPPFVYGPRNPFYREAFFWDRLTAGRPILVPGDGSRLMHFVLVEDLVNAALLAAEIPAAAGRAYNVAHVQPVRQDEFVRMLGEASGIEPDLRYIPRETVQELGGQVFQPPYYFGQYFDMPPITLNVTRAREELGFEPVSLAQGLRQTWQWYSDSDGTLRDQPDFSFDDIALAALA
ncbi:MAG: NAD-dependent epimerase/dehydratase family protein [Bryobacterales bacterium]|nr:NAD-dependent epimerase/dehydratase family protein [Bryobacterales bacterium]